MYSSTHLISENDPVNDPKNSPSENDFYSVEFGLKESEPVYQFKLWHSDRTPHFFLIKDTSALTSQLKVGNVILMKYYCNDPMRSIEQRQTRIEAIVNETNGRFKGHYRIKIGIIGNDIAGPLQATGTDQ